jgi:hypothetical protein
MRIAIREYQVLLFRDCKLSPGTIEGRTAALRFLFVKTLRRPYLPDHIPFPGSWLPAHRRYERFTSSWRDVPSPDAGRIVGSNLRLGHLQGGSSANALQERVCTSQCAPNSPDSVRCRTAWRSSLIRNSRGTRTLHGVRDHGDFPATRTGGHYTMAGIHALPSLGLLAPSLKLGPCWR